MNINSIKVHIIGGGVSGLVAAQVLENHGLSPVIIDANDRVGGRLKTDAFRGFQLDRGFQVLLSSYSAAKKYLDYKSLNLQKLKAGSCVFAGGKQYFFGDPLRDMSLFMPTLFSPLGTLSDKLKIAKLNFHLQKKTIDKIFKDREITTKEYLTSIGFSKNIIKNFFTPFFSGIYLESELNTSSRMFEFVFKMFGEGLALLPKGGIEEISKQLKNKLKKTKILFNTVVSEVKDKEIILSDGKKIKTHYAIVAAEPSNLVRGLKNQKVEWKSCQNLYFTCSKRVYEKAFIGLVSNQECLINNIFYPTSIPASKKGKDELISVTVVKDHGLPEEELIERIQNELREECKIEDVTFLKLYNIPQALPKLNNLKYDISPTETKLKDGVFLAGDVLLNGSLNAAILAGEKAAMGVLEAAEKNIVKG
ncbi:FAD-dependent oxidoreductase [Bacteroidota bacterium]|nr:FAD-dependent oxidoreductase [Bacteroidota bacterium]